MMQEGVPDQLGDDLYSAWSVTTSQEKFSRPQAQRKGQDAAQKIKSRKERTAFPGSAKPAGNSGP